MPRSTWPERRQRARTIQDAAKHDLIIAALAAMSLILLIMMFITRSMVAALVIVGTVALSLGASFGLSVLVWQYIFCVPQYQIVLALAVILLLAVGADQRTPAEGVALARAQPSILSHEPHLAH